MAEKVKDTNGCYVVPAFTGLGAPHWDAYARGAILGLTRGVNRYHIIRATLDSLCYQTNDVLEAMKMDLGQEVKRLKADGGASANNYLLQTQADLTGVQVDRPAIGTAYRLLPALKHPAPDFLFNLWEEAAVRFPSSGKRRDLRSSDKKFK